MEYGCRTDAELNVELAVTFLGIELPDLVAVEIEAGKLAGADEDVDMFAIGAGGSGGRVAFVAPCPTGFLGGEGFRPEFLAVFSAEAHQCQHLFFVLCRQKEFIAPDDRCRTAHAGHWHAPEDVLVLRPLARQPGFLADAIARRPAPLGPVVGLKGGKNEYESGGAKQKTHEHG